MKKETKRLIVRGTFFVIYLALGMVVFRVLESHNEQLGVSQAKKAINRMFVKYNISDDEMREFVNTIIEAESWGYTNGWLEKWSFTGSLFFSGTVITTIGKVFVLNLFSKKNACIVRSGSQVVCNTVFMPNGRKTRKNHYFGGLSKNCLVWTQN